VVEDKVVRPRGEQVRVMWHFFLPQCFDTVGSATGRASSCWVLVCWWWWFLSCLIVPVFITTSIVLSANKIQNGDIPVHAYPCCTGNWLQVSSSLVTSLLQCFYAVGWSAERHPAFGKLPSN